MAVVIGTSLKLISGMVPGGPVGAGAGAAAAVAATGALVSALAVAMAAFVLASAGAGAGAGAVATWALVAASMVLVAVAMGVWVSLITRLEDTVAGAAVAFVLVQSAGWFVMAVLVWALAASRPAVASSVIIRVM